MTVYNIYCCSPNHSSRTEEPDYADPIGTIEADTEPTCSSCLLCPACARLDFTLDDLKQWKMDLIDQRTEELIYAGFEYPTSSGKYFSASRNMQRTLMGTFVIKDHASLSYPITWCCNDNTNSITLSNATDVENFYLTGLSHIRTCKDGGTSLKDQVMDATTVEEVLAVEDTR